ncbi:MAG: hypothetical protein COA88_06190 [Kordia sp.]|nr:MAG: hypothetical protein COA88_06190 [Kordia sp.]
MKKQFMYVLLFCSILITSCGSIKIAIYDQYSYQQEVSLKIETKALLEHATEEYAIYKDQITHVLLEMEKMEEYEKNKPDNAISYQMWHLMTDADRNSVAGLFKRWKEKGQLPVVFTQEASVQVMGAFDALIKYEVSKDKEKENILLEIIKNY